MEVSNATPPISIIINFCQAHKFLPKIIVKFRIIP